MIISRSDGRTDNQKLKGGLLRHLQHDDFPDTNETSGHRPVHAKFNLSQSDSISKQDILEKIEKLKEDIENLKIG